MREREKPIALVVSLCAWLAMLGFANAIILSGRYESMPGFAYNQTLLAINYVNSGFARRGLAGTIALLFGGPGNPASVAYFHVASSIWLATPLAILIYLVSRTAGLRTAAAFALLVAVSPLLFLSWSPDIARVDMLSLGFVAWAVIASVHSGSTTASILLCLGALCHEIALIFGFPLLLVIEHEKRRAIRFFAVCAALLVPLYAMQFLLTAPADRLVANMDAIGQGAIGDLAIYAYVWNFIPTAICLNLASNFYWPSLAICTVLIALLVVAHSAGLRDSAAFTFAALLPFLAISAISTDVGRWLSAAALTVWLLAASLVILRQQSPWPNWLSLTTCLGLALIAWSPGPSEPLYPNIALKRFGISLGWQELWPIEPWLEKCAPQWRETLSSAKRRTAL